MNKPPRGITLIELLVVVAIIAILTAVAYPSYREYVREAQCSEAHTNLLRIVDLQERFYVQNNRYGNTAEIAFAPTDNYTYSIAQAAPTNTFTAVATDPNAATGGQLACRNGCGTISIDNVGQRTPPACW